MDGRKPSTHGRGEHPVLKTRRRLLADAFTLLLAVLVLSSSCSPSGERTPTLELAATSSGPAPGGEQTPTPAAAAPSTPTAMPTGTPTQAPSPTPEPTRTDQTSIFVEPPLTEEQIAAIRVYRKPSGEMAKPYLHALTETEIAGYRTMVADLLGQGKIAQSQADRLSALYADLFSHGGIGRISMTIEGHLGYAVPGPGILERGSGVDFVGPVLGFVKGVNSEEGEGATRHFSLVLGLDPRYQDPIKNPEEFWFAEVGANPEVKTEVTTLVLLESSTGNVRRINKSGEGEQSGRGIHLWSIGKLADFGLFEGAPVFLDTFTLDNKMATICGPVVLQFPGATTEFVLD
jgi:hypothetical protein